MCLATSVSVAVMAVIVAVGLALEVTVGYYS